MPFTLVPWHCPSEDGLCSTDHWSDCVLLFHCVGVAINTWCAGDEIEPCHLSAAGTVAWHHVSLVAMRHCSQSQLGLGLLHTAGGQVWGAAWTPHPVNTETPCRSVPPGWTYEHDMELGRFLYDHSEKKLQSADCTKEHINSIEVSSHAVRSGAPLQPQSSTRHVSISTDVGWSGPLWLSPLQGAGHGGGFCCCSKAVGSWVLESKPHCL